MFDVITIGDATLDTFVVIDESTPGCTIDKTKRHLLLNYGEKISIKKTTQSIGGNAANVAVGLKKLGYRTTIVSELGDDMSGLVIQHELDKAGVDTSLVRFRKGKETRYSVILNYLAERTVLSYHAPRNYSLPTLPATSWIYFTSLGVTFERVQTKLIAHLSRHKTTKLAVNPGSHQIKAGLKQMKALLPHIHVLFVNKEEAAALAGTSGSPKELLGILLGKGVATVVITDSERGSYAATENAYYFLPSFPTTPIGKTGAGDAYASGFLGAILKDLPVEEAMRWGTANATSVIGVEGAQNGLLSKTAISKRLKQTKDTHPKELK